MTSNADSVVANRRSSFDAGLKAFMNRILLSSCLSMTSASEQSSDARAKKLSQPSAEL